MQSLSKVRTAGVYVKVAGFFPFQVGPTQRGDTLGVIRLGGHREADETGWECAAREAFEEASLRVMPLHPPATYWVEVTEPPVFQVGSWNAGPPDEVAPILVSTRKEESMTPIYLGYTHDTPQPSAEAKALLLLRPEDIHQLVLGTITLGSYLDMGGKALFKEDLPTDFVLEPFPHLRFLHQLILIHPEITQSSERSYR
ncbi:DNA mismatch repair protein MutT [Tengunoibacter tsumagoiensis]|uniref:DNA mismatch repair protein MutT n=2 Tax=Tengunoibacter tsumagoiensis TaxID=2014871 RepID=A0A402A604_9CHLR|nr:DNA mismatch repair protein MutT [Tengunoibacter tsumagoiensis]